MLSYITRFSKNDIDDATAGTSTSDIIDWKKTQEKDTRLQYWREKKKTTP
jgi:hypothetical protein